MALPSELWFRQTPQGAKDGTSLANAAGVDPNAADDIWDIINADPNPPANGTKIHACADVPLTIGAAITINCDAATSNPIYVVGRNAADTADAQVVIDAGGGAFPVLDMVTADVWLWFRTTFQNTDGLTPNNGITVGANADYCRFIDCKASDCYDGWSILGAQTHLLRCLGYHNARYGVNGGGLVRVIDSMFRRNGSHGAYSVLSAIRSTFAYNGGVGLYWPYYLADECVFYGNTGYGVAPFVMFTAIIRNCIAALNSTYGIDCSDYWPLLENFAHYGNTSGGINGTDYFGNVIALTADPFVQAAPHYALAAGASGATATDFGANTSIEDLTGAQWPGAQIGDEVYFDDSETTYILSVGTDAILCSPQITAAAQKKCLVGGGDFRLNNVAGGGALCRAIAHEVANLSSTPAFYGYPDLGAYQSAPGLRGPAGMRSGRQL